MAAIAGELARDDAFQDSTRVVGGGAKHVRSWRASHFLDETIVNNGESHETEHRHEILLQALPRVKWSFLFRTFGVL